jgi:GAF domain-containing protein
MSALPQPEIERDRLEALRALCLIGTAPEPHFDAVCRTAQALFGVPVCLISLVEEHEQWFKARCGLDLSGTSRAVSFCAHAILSDAVFVVPDATRDARFSDNPLVTGPPGIRFYAGAPLILRPGIRVGTLCLIDTRPRDLSAAEAGRLEDLAQVVVAHLRLHESLRTGEAMARERAADRPRRRRPRARPATATCWTPRTPPSWARSPRA